MRRIRVIAIKWGSLLAALALMVAKFSVGVTCSFTAYQPKVPDQLKN